MGGVERNTQFMRCPTWSEIQENYPMACRGELGRIMHMKRPWADGRLMIWHGPPGNGKTFGIRSLLMAWREQFNFIIVADPEKMMASPSYYYEVASAPNMNSVPGSQPQDDDDEDSSVSKKKRLLFILEDTADLISTESRQRHWDKFGKLLNITDGLIGQGREDIFLISFNEQLEAIDPAITRPGRCISRVEFPKFTQEEAQEWLAKNKLSHLETSGADTLEPVTLAELYQMKAKAKKQVPVTV
jgi:SpoVK/Ycf46/Vps4 family AAA+-type ATPase